MDVTAPGRALHGKFLLLGNMNGKTADEIVAVVGRPISTSSMAEGMTLMKWIAKGFSVLILFRANGQFLTIMNQHAYYVGGLAIAAAKALIILD